MLLVLVSAVMVATMTACSSDSKTTGQPPQTEKQVQADSDNQEKAKDTSAADTDGTKGSGAKIDIAFCNVAPSSHPQNIAYRAFADKVKTETDGNITITVYDNAQMGNILELFQQTIDGTIQMCIRDRPITCPDDMKGLTMRVPENQCDLALVEACGASPTTMASNEVYTALQTGVVDGHDFGAIITMTGGYDEVTKYYTDDNHLLKLNAVFANQSWWDGLDAADRDYLADEIYTMCRQADKGCWDLEASILDGMEASESMELHRLTDEERQQFVDIGESLWDKFNDRIDTDLLKRIQDEIAERK